MFNISLLYPDSKKLDTGNGVSVKINNFPVTLFRINNILRWESNGEVQEREICNVSQKQDIVTYYGQEIEFKKKPRNLWRWQNEAVQRAVDLAIGHRGRIYSP